MLAQIFSLFFAPLFALATLGTAPGRTRMDGCGALHGWDRSEVSLAAELREGPPDDRARLEVRQIAEGLEVEVRIPRHRFILGFHRAPVRPSAPEARA